MLTWTAAPLEVLMRSVPPLAPWRLWSSEKGSRTPAVTSPRCRESMAVLHAGRYNL